MSTRTGLPRTEVSLVESGHNLGSSPRIRRALAHGFGVPVEELDAYFGGLRSLEEIAAQVPPIEGSGEEKGRALAKFPRLRDAVKLVARDSGLAEDVVRDVAMELAVRSRTGPDKSTMDWGQALEARIRRLRSGIRLNPLGIPSLATAIRLFAQEHPAREADIIHVAAGLATRLDNPQAPTAAAWFRTLDAELEKLGFEQTRALPSRAKGRGRGGKPPSRKRR